MQRGEKWLWALTLIILIASIISFGLPYLFEDEYRFEIAEAQSGEPEKPKVIHLETPEPLKALYMTACVASMDKWRDDLKKTIEETELNAVVIDIKDYTGAVSFKNEVSLPNPKGCLVSDLKEFIEELHASGIYVIGRISVFQDPNYAEKYPEQAVKSKKSGGVWRDHKGLAFVDVGAKPYWDYIVSLSQVSHELGFDELNYDYVRYPSDGVMADADFSWTVSTSTKSEMLENFFRYLKEKTSSLGAVTSVDIFGMTTSTTHDLGIGQVLEKALPYFDYVAPMVYPSHYPKGWNGFESPAKVPYEVIYKAMGDGREREIAFNISQGLATSTPTKLRTWIQDFSLGGDYGPEEVRAQIRASNEVGVPSWMLWSAANKYTVEALLVE